MYFFADHVAQAAAQAGARKARDDADADPAGWSGQATGTAEDYIRQLGPNLLDGPGVRRRRPTRPRSGSRSRPRSPRSSPG